MFERIHNMPRLAKAADLRTRAEEIARETADQSPEDIDKMSPAEAKQTLHELRVHQIELDMQNEELQRAQQEVEDSRARYFDLYDMAPIGYFTINEHGQILEANLTAATLLGVARSKLISQFLSHFIHKDDQNIYYLHHKKLLQAGEPQAYNLRIIKKGKTQLWAHLEATAAQVLQEDSTIRQDSVQAEPVYRIMLSDITLYKQAEDEMYKAKVAAEASEQAKSLLLAKLNEGQQIANIGSWDWDMISNTVWWSEQTYRIFEVDPGLFVPSVEENASFFHPDDRAKFIEKFNKAIQTGKLLDTELRLVTRAGTVKNCHAQGKIIYNQEGKPLRYIGTIMDVTSLKRADIEILSKGYPRE